MAGLWGSAQEHAEPPAQEDTPGLLAGLSHSHPLQRQVPHAPARLTMLCGGKSLKPPPLKGYSRTVGCSLWDQGKRMGTTRSTLSFWGSKGRVGTAEERGMSGARVDSPRGPSGSRHCRHHHAQGAG